MKRLLEDSRISGYTELFTPDEIKKDMVISEKAARTVMTGREEIARILAERDQRLLGIVGPCSIHDKEAGLEYARRFNELRDYVKETMFLVMRVYFEKPRTNVGWKGLINDPDLNGTYNMEKGLLLARDILLQISDMGIPIGTEVLEAVTSQYIADLISWAAIGARTTESPIHREITSGLSMPVGFKNGTDGGINCALNAIIAANAEQTFLGVNPEGRISIVKTKGNSFCHIVLRGGIKPNYYRDDIMAVQRSLEEKNLLRAILVDCSHGNSSKMHQLQEEVLFSVVDQRLAGNESIIGFMLESNLQESNQKLNGNRESLEYGVSITDECISWETTERIILEAHERLLAG